MGKAIDLVTGRATNPGAAFTGVTFASGDSGSVRAHQLEAGAWMVGLWATEGTAGRVRVRSPRMHDNVQGLRFSTIAAVPRNLLPKGVRQRVFPQDTLSVELTGGAAETDVASLLIYYRDLPGVDSRLATWEEIEPRIVNLVTVENTPTSSATAGDYGGAEALDTDFDLLKANTDYAILGYVSSVQVHAITYRGPDTGNMRIAGPGTTERIETRNWFKDMAQELAMPFIPVFNAANKSSTFVEAVDVAASTAVTTQTLLAELGA